MQALVNLAQAATLVVFLALAATCLHRWRSRRDQPTKWAGLTFGVLAAVLLVSWLTPETGGEVVEWERKVTIAILIAFPYCLYRFSAAFQARTPRLELPVAVASGVLAVVSLLLPYLPAEGDERPAWFKAFLVGFIGFWTLVSFIVAIRLWRAGSAQPTVVRARLRVLSLGAVSLSLALVTAGAAQRGGVATELVVQLWALASALLFFVGVAPPRLLLVAWRTSEQTGLQRAVQELVRATRYEDLQGLLPHVAGVVGGRGAALIAADGKPIAHSGVEAATATKVGQALVDDGRDSSSAERMAFPLASGWLVVWMSPYTPFFGRGDIDLLRSVAGLLDVAMERIRLTELEMQARKDLEREKEFADSLIRSTSDGLLAWDREFRYTLWNPAMQEITGVSASEVLGQVALERFPFMEENGEHLYFEAALRGERVVLAERYFDVPELDTQGWFETSYSPLYDARGDVIGGLSVVRDVTARKEAEELKAHLAAIVDSSDDAIYSRDLNGTIMSWNAGAERLFGYRAEEVVGQSSSILVPPDRAGEFSDILAEIGRGGRIEDLETVRVAKDGSQLLVSLTVSPITDAEGEIVAAATIARDITERVRAEEALHVAKEEAEQANQAKSEFLSRMSHELRTPLNAILGFVQLLELEDLSDEKLDNVRQIHRAGSHLLDLINEVLDISRIEVGQMTLSLEPVPVRHVVAAAVSLATPLAAERNVELRSRDADECSFYVHADVQRFKQVLLNLLSNAIKYNRDEGAVIVSCERSSERWVRVTVSDTGRGIEPTKMERLFEPFDRLDADQWGVEGVGLGLALSKRLAEAMGGRLQGESTVGSGSSFWIELPLAKGPTTNEAEDDRRRQVDTETRQANATVLYIEDNVSNATLVQRILERRPGITLMDAIQGRLGLELARQHRPDLILLDLHLPDLPGAEVLRLLREDAATADIPVAVVSADATQGQVDRLLESGALDYLTKPIDVAALLALVDRTVESARSRLSR
jgi:PAS domain S-box-containing protein